MCSRGCSSIQRSWSSTRNSHAWTRCRAGSSSSCIAERTQKGVGAGSWAGMRGRYGVSGGT